MSYDITYAKMVIEIPADESFGYPARKPIYLPVEIFGSSNLYYADTNRRVRCAYLLNFFRTHYEVMEMATRTAISCNGGSLKANGKDIYPESYIASWRKCLKNPMPYEMAKYAFPHFLGFTIIFERLSSDESSELVDAYNIKGLSKSDDGYTLHLNLANESDLNLFRKLSGSRHHFKLLRGAEVDDEYGNLQKEINYYSKVSFEK